MWRRLCAADQARISVSPGTFSAVRGLGFWASANVTFIKKQNSGLRDPPRAAFMCLELQTKAAHGNIAWTCLHQQKTPVVIWAVIAVLLRLFHLVYLMMPSMAEWTQVHAGIYHKGLVPVQTLRGLPRRVHMLADLINTDRLISLSLSVSH